MRYIATSFTILLLLVGATTTTSAQQKLDPLNYFSMDNFPNSPTSGAGTPGTTTNTPEYFEVGPWWTGASTSGYLGGYRQTSQLGGEVIAGRSATWVFDVPVGSQGVYIVYTYVLQAVNNASNVYYTVQREFESKILDSVRHDLRRSTVTQANVGIGAWVPLMIDTLNVGKVFITVGADTMSGSAIMRADGIRIVRSSSTGADLEFARRLRDGFDTVRVGENWTDAPLGSITYKEIPLFNYGKSNLIVNKVSVTTTPSRWDIKLPLNASFPLVIPPGQKKMIAVGFRPFQEESVKDTLVIESNDSLELKATIPISGNGINYNFILNASLANEPFYNAPFDKLGDSRRPQITRVGAWFNSGTGISAFPYPIAGGNPFGLACSDAVCSIEYRFQLPDSVNGKPGSSGYYYIEHGAIPFTSNSENNAQVTIVPAFSIDTVRSAFNQSGLSTPPFFYPLSAKPLQLNQGDFTSVLIYRTVATAAVLRADLLRVRKIPTGPSIAANPQLSFGNVSIYPEERNKVNNYRQTIELSSGGETALRIDSITITNARYYTIENKPDAGTLLPAVNGTFSLKVTFTPDTIATLLNSTLRVYTNDSTQNPFTVLITGNGVGTGLLVEESDASAAYIYPAGSVVYPDYANMNKWQSLTSGSASNGSSLVGFIYKMQGDPSNASKASYIEYFPQVPILAGHSIELDTFNVYVRTASSSSNSSPAAKYIVYPAAGGEPKEIIVNQNGRGDRVLLGAFTFLRSDSRDAHNGGAINGFIRLENDTNLVSAYYKDSLVNRARQDSFLVRADAIILQEATLTGVEYEVLPNVPNTYSLSQNYPNPFNPTTKIQFGLPVAENVQVKIYDILGREVRALVNEKYDAGMYSVQWDGKNSFGRQVATGMYIYQIRAGQFVQTKKMLLMK